MGVVLMTLDLYYNLWINLHMLFTMLIIIRHNVIH